MAGLDFTEKMQEASKNITNLEQMIGKGLMQPFNGTNAGARKIMFGTHKEHQFPLMGGEKAVVETGYEIRFGDESSSIIRADADYKIIAKISKFSFAPNHHYWLILQDINNNRLDIVERISYEHITESYGYLYNNEYMDSLSVGDYIPNNTIVQKSLAFDEYNNRKDGVNFNVVYMALDDNMEDSIIASNVAAGKLTSPLVKPISIMINNNDIPLNIYGDDKVYKIIPDIGEDIVDAKLIALRKEKKEEAYYAQSVDRLRKTIMSDELKQVHGKVIDVDIYCNNPDILDNHYYAQLKMYYQELHRMAAEFVQVLLPYSSENFEFSYELEKKFANAKRIMNGDQYIDKRNFSNIILNITVLEEKEMEAGDKASNRYGGKGVFSDIWDQKYMPRFKNAKGEYEYVDIIFNSSTMINRENVGQSFELSLTHIGSEILHRIVTEKCSLEEAYEMIKTYIQFCSPEQAEDLERTKQNMTRDELAFFIESIIDSGSIQLSMRPLSDVMTIDKLGEIYKAFPWVKQNEIEVPLVSSNGTIRYIPARRPVVIGKQYIFRLKQYAEEKFSSTSLSATNIRNENTKSRARKDFRELYPNTPIRFGNMETNNMGHLGVDVVISNLMIHSVSPQGRRLVEQMYTGDPFKIDIRLDSDSKNRSAEIANTYLKTIGRRLLFTKRLKKYDVITMSPIEFTKDPVSHPISFVPESMREGFDYEKDFEERQKINKEREKCESPIIFEGIRRKRNKR
mgnify:CR=1 FL=1